MISKTLIDILRTFKKDEIKKLGEFADSPYHNKQKYVALLFKELVKFYPAFEHAELNKINIYKKMYPAKVYSDTRMRNITSDLINLTERFIETETFIANRFDRMICLLESLPAKQLDTLFEKRYSQAESLLETNSPENELLYLNKLRLQQARSVFVNRRRPNDVLQETECYQQITNETIKFFLCSLFKNYSIMLNKNTSFFNFDYEKKLIDVIMRYMEENNADYAEDTSILLYYYFTLFYLKYDEESYYRLDVFTRKNFEKLEQNDAMNALIHMTNYCRRQALSGKNEFNQKVHELMVFALDKKLWSDENKIRPSVFRIIVSTACVCGEFDWCINFIEDYKQLQPKEHIQSNANLCFGRLYFEKKDYAKALEYLGKVSIIDAAYKYETDTLIIRIFYETGEIESYINKTDTFKRWLLNNKTLISDHYKKIFSDMAGYFERLIKLKLAPDEFKLQKIKNEIEDDKTLVNRQWFLEKIKELLRQ